MLLHLFISSCFFVPATKIMQNENETTNSFAKRVGKYVLHTHAGEQSGPFLRRDGEEGGVG